MGRKLGFAIAQFARGHTFVLRLVLALFASVALMLVASQMFFTRAASRELLEQDARSYAADAKAIERRTPRETTPSTGWTMRSTSWIRWRIDSPSCRRSF